MRTKIRPAPAGSTGGRSPSVHVRADGPHPAPKPKSKKYTTSEELSALIRCWRLKKAGMKPVKLARLQEVIHKLADGVWSRWQHIDSKEEFRQECWVNCLLKSFRRVKKDGNAFSYLTTCFINVGNNLRLKEVRERIGEHGYRGEYIRAERYITHAPE